MLLAEKTFLGRLLGDDPEKGGNPTLHWGLLPESWGVFVLITIILAALFFVIWLYINENKTCSRPTKIFLALLRSMVVLTIIVFLLKPYIIRKKTRTLKPTIGFLRDGSLSFNRADQYSDQEQVKRIAAGTGWNTDDIAAGKYTRAQILQQLFNRNSGQLLNAMRDKGSIQIIDFADITKQVGTIPAIGESTDKDKKADDDKKSDDSKKDDTKSADKNKNVASKSDDSKTKTDDSSQPKMNNNRLPVLIADGRGTDIHSAIRELLNDPSQLSAIIISTDGQHNGSGDLVELAAEAKKKKIPIFVIPFGDPKPPKNLKVDNLAVRSPVRPAEPFEIDAVVYANQVNQEKIKVDLVQFDVNETTEKLENETIIETKEVDLRGNLIRVGFQHTPNNPGKYVFSIRAQVIDGETEIDDNIKSTEIVQVVDQKVKVLLIAGAPTWEYRMVQRLLQRDSSISLSCWLQTMDEDRPQEGNEPIIQLPRNIEELGLYNVVMMFDPNPNEFDEEWVKTLRQFVRRKAGGFLYMTGPKYSTEFVTLNRLSVIREILPVRFGEDLISLGELSDINRPGKMLPVEFNLDHPVMKFDADPAANKDLWAIMPSIFWSFPTLAAKPTARVLLESGMQINADGNSPLLVSSRYGAGNVLYMGFNGTWRWRRVGVQAQYFDRFWIQIIRFLVETRSLQGKSRGIIDPDRTEYEIGDRVTLTAQVLDERFEPYTAQSIEAKIQGEDGRVRPIKLNLLPGQPGNYRASYVAQQTGTFKITVDLGTDEDEELIVPISFRVFPPRIESTAFWQNSNLLKQLASESDGKYITLDKVSTLADLLPRLETKTDINRPPIPFWDTKLQMFGTEIPIRYFVFGLLVLLLTVEWAVRKKTKLL